MEKRLCILALFSCDLNISFLVTFTLLMRKNQRDSMSMQTSWFLGFTGNEINHVSMESCCLLLEYWTLMWKWSSID